MDLSKFDLNKDSVANGAVMTVAHPQTGEDLLDDKGTPVTITLLGKDSPEFKKVLRRNANKKIDYMQSTGRKIVVKVEDLEKDGLELAVAATKAWSGINVDGALLECVPENVESTYNRFPWLREQVESFINNRANYLKNS